MNGGIEELQAACVRIRCGVGAPEPAALGDLGPYCKRWWTQEALRLKVLPSVLLAGMLIGCGPPGTGDEVGGNGALASTGTELPLTSGFYVMNDAACGDASAATLLLILPGSMIGARDACDLRSVEQRGSTSYHAAVICTDAQGGETEQSIYRYEIPDSTRFSYSTEDSDYRSHFRYCEQSRLPEPWRDNDVSDLLGQ